MAAAQQVADTSYVTSAVSGSSPSMLLRAAADTARTAVMTAIVLISFTISLSLTSSSRTLSIPVTG